MASVYRTSLDFMRIPCFITVAILMTAFIVGCSKSSSGSSSTAVKDLELSTNAPTHVTIDARHEGIITPTALPNGQLLLHIEIKSAGSVTPAPRVVVIPDQEFTVQTKDMAAPVRFKVKLKP